MEDQPPCEGKLVDAFIVMGRKRAVVCPICGRWEKVPDLHQEDMGKIIEKYCEKYFGWKCRPEEDWCKYRVRL